MKKPVKNLNNWLIKLEKSERSDKNNKPEKERKIESDMGKRWSRQKESPTNKQWKENYSWTKSKREETNNISNNWLKKWEGNDNKN